MRYFLIFIAFIPIFSYGQYGVAPIIPFNGFVIPASGDTLIGKIRYTKLIGNYMSAIKFIDQDNIKTDFSAYELQGMGIENPFFDAGNSDEVIPVTVWEIYEPRPHPKKQLLVFMQRFLNGRLKVFLNRSSNQKTKTKTKTKFNGISFEYISGEGLFIGPTYSVVDIEINARFSSYYIEKDGDHMVFINKKNYDILWHDLFGDCELIQEEIQNNPDLKEFKNFLIVAEVYNFHCQ